MTTRVTKSAKYKQSVPCSKLLRVENVIQMDNLHIPISFQAPFKLFWNLWQFRRLMGTSADQVNKFPDIFAPAVGNIPDGRSLSALFRGGCATFIREENLVGFIKLIHTAIRPQSHLNPSQTCLLSSIQTRLKLVSWFLWLLNRKFRPESLTFI